MLLHKVLEIGAVTVDAERIRQRKRDAMPGVMRQLARIFKGFLGLRLVVKIDVVLHILQHEKRVT